MNHFSFQMNILIVQNPYEFFQFFYVYEKTVFEK